MKRSIMFAIICVAGMHTCAVAMSATDYESMYNIAEVEAEQRRHEEELARAARAGAYATGYSESTPDYSGQRERQRKAEDRAARERKESAYSEYYGGLAAQEEAKYEQKLQEFEQMTNKAYEEAVQTIEQEKRAAQALSNILRSAQIEERYNEQIAIAAEKAEQTVAVLEHLMQMSERETERASRMARTQEEEQEREKAYQARGRAVRTHAAIERWAQRSEQDFERAQRVATAREKEQELEKAYQAAREAEVALERIIRSADYEARFNDAIRRDIERNEQQLEEVRLKIKKKTEALRLQIQFEEASAKFNEDWQRAQEDINNSYAKKAAHQLENLKHAIQNLKKDIIDPALQQAADNVAHAVARVSQAVSQNLPWKEQAQQAATQAQTWMMQADAWIAAQIGFVAKLPGGLNAWMAAHAGVVGPHAGRDIAPQMRGQTGTLTPETKKMAFILVNNYRQTVKAFDSRKQWRANSGYANLLQNIIAQFNAIKAEIQANPDLKRAVTTAVVPLLVRMWKSENVIIEYIDGYLKKLEYELGNVSFQSQFQRPLNSQA